MSRRSSPTDTNGTIAGLLRDLASVQVSEQSRRGYERAAATIIDLEATIENFVGPDGTLRKIPQIGPSSTRVILEVLRTGSSPTVERAIAESHRSTQVEENRKLRGHFLSRAQVIAALQNKRLRGPRLEDFTAATFRCTRSRATAARRCRTSSKPVSAAGTITALSPITPTGFPLPVVSRCSSSSSSIVRSIG
jgi:hypothetical protein